MAITITVGNDDAEKPQIQRRINLDVRKTLDGQIIVRDHKEIDVVIDPNEGTVSAFPKEDLHDDVYAAQDRLFDFLTKKGVIKRETIAAGNVFASMQGEIPQSVVEGVDATQVTLLSIANWIEDERPTMEMQQEMEQSWIEKLTEPEDAESTELGEVPHEAEKGTIDPSNNIRRYLGGAGIYYE